MLTEHVIKLDEHVFIVTLLVKQSSQFFFNGSILPRSRDEKLMRVCVPGL